MEKDNYNLNFDKIISFDIENFIQNLKDLARSVGIGYEKILDNISHDCETNPFWKLVVIAEKVKDVI